MAVDSYFYGKLVIAPLNILLYNVFTPHGPDLYGIIDTLYILVSILFGGHASLIYLLFTNHLTSILPL